MAPSPQNDVLHRNVSDIPSVRLRGRQWLSPGDAKFVECIKIRVDVTYLPDIIPDSLRTVRIAAAAGLDCHICHAAQHCIGAEPGSVFFQCGTVFIQGLAFDEWFCSVFLPIGTVPGRIDREIAVSGLIQHKIKPRFVIIVICKRTLIRIMCGLQCSISVHFSTYFATSRQPLMAVSRGFPGK